MKKEVKNLNRLDLFNHYDSYDNPFLIVNTKVDITNIYNKCKNYYASIAYFLTLAANQIENFKLRYENGKFYKYDNLIPNFVQLKSDGNIGFIDCNLKEKYSDFISEYKSVQENFKQGKICYTKTQGKIWNSYVPWYNFNSLVTPFDKSITIPQFNWDKFSFENDKCYINLMIMAHHGFVDGSHVGQFLQNFNDIVKNIDKYLK